MLDIEVHTSVDVISELYPEQQAIFHAFQQAGKLIVHNISGDDRLAIQQRGFPKSLSASDQTVLFLALALEALVLSSDRVVRQYAKKSAIEYHGMIWIFDQMVEMALLPGSIACMKLEALIQQNRTYQNNIEMTVELEKRIRKWKTLS